MGANKPFNNLNKQITKLRGRGLLITSEAEAKRQLLKTSYYDLINGYKDMFLEIKEEKNIEEKYIEGTKFEDLTMLYKLDRELRHIVMRATLDAECNFYTTIAYCVSEKYGEKEEDYLNIKNFRRGTKQAIGGFERDNLLYRVQKRIDQAHEHPMKYYKQKYKNVPPWILVKHLSFGELIVWYKLSTSDVKDSVIRRFTGMEPTEELKEFFLKSMELFNKFRNRAAHGGRIYNFRTNIEIPYDENLHNLFYISKKYHNIGKGRSDFSSFLLALLHLNQNDYSDFIEQVVILKSWLDDYKKESPLYIDGVLDELGLPDNYNKQIMKKILKEH